MTSRLSGPAAIVALVVLSAFQVRAEEHGKAEADAERRFALGLGGAVEWSPSGGVIHPGANAFLSVTVVEHWLELKASVSYLPVEGSFELPAVLLFNKPFELSHHVDLTIGVGPELLRVPSGVERGNFFGLQVAVGLFVWPTRHVGFWVEPAYDLIFRPAATHSFGATAGIVFGF